jgi:hypothetical protein
VQRDQAAQPALRRHRPHQPGVFSATGGEAVITSRPSHGPTSGQRRPRAVSSAPGQPVGQRRRQCPGSGNGNLIVVPGRRSGTSPTAPGQRWPRPGCRWRTTRATSMCRSLRPGDHRSRRRSRQRRRLRQPGAAGHHPPKTTFAMGASSPPSASRVPGGAATDRQRLVPRAINEYDAAGAFVRRSPRGTAHPSASRPRRHRVLSELNLDPTTFDRVAPACARARPDGQRLPPRRSAPPALPGGHRGRPRSSGEVEQAATLTGHRPGRCGGEGSLGGAFWSTALRWTLLLSAGRLAGRWRSERLGCRRLCRAEQRRARGLAVSATVIAAGMARRLPPRPIPAAAGSDAAAAPPGGCRAISLRTVSWPTAVARSANPWRRRTSRQLPGGAADRLRGAGSRRRLHHALQPAALSSGTASMRATTPRSRDAGAAQSA